MGARWHGDRGRLVVLHVVESFGSGTASAVTSYTGCTKQVEHHLLYAVRAAAFKPANEFDNFETASEFDRRPWSAIRAVRSAVKRVQPDVVHAHSSFAGLLVRLAVARSKRLSIVYTPHCFGFEKLNYSRPVRKAIRVAESLLAVNTTAFAACSEYEAHLCRTIGRGRRVKFVPNVDDSERRDCGPEPRVQESVRLSGPLTAQVVVAMGRLEPQKDPSWFAEACRMDASERRWVWIGDGSKTLRAELEGSGVEVTGWLPRTDALERLKNADVYVHTAAWEGFPMTVLEAARREVPVVVRSIPCFEGLPASIVANSPKVVVEKINRIASTEDAKRNIGYWCSYLAGNTPEEQERALMELYVGQASRREAGKVGGALVVHWGRTGGGPRFTYELANALARVGELSGVSYNRMSELSDRFSRVSSDRLEVSTYRSKIGVILGLPGLVLTCLRFRAFVKRLKPDYVVCAMESVYQSLAVPLVLPRGVTYYFSVHDASDHPGEENLIKRTLRRLERHRATAYLTYSRAVGEQVQSQVDKPVLISVLPAAAANSASHTASASRVHPHIREGHSRATTPLVAGFFGRLQRYKGVEQLLEVAQILDQQSVPVRIAVWGSGPEGRWQEHDERRLIDWHVGWVPEEDVLPIIESFDILVCPYQEASQSLVIAQAMTCGVPSVATPVGGIEEQVAETGCGILAAATSAPAIADAIKLLVEDPVEYERRSLNGIEAAATTYSWNRLVSDLIDFHKSSRNRS